MEGFRIPIVSDIIDAVKGPKKPKPFLDIDPTTKKYLMVGGGIFFIIIVFAGIYMAMQPSMMDRMMAQKQRAMTMKMGMP